MYKIYFKYVGAILIARIQRDFSKTIHTSPFTRKKLVNYEC